MIPMPVDALGHFDDYLAQLFPVDLAQLNAQAALQTRVDRKYIVPLAAALDVLADCIDRSLLDRSQLDQARLDRPRVLDIDGVRRMGYESLYFDTDDHRYHHLAAQRRPIRLKVRIRRYLSTNTCWLELKIRDRSGRTVKSRLPYRWATAPILDDTAEEFLAQDRTLRPHIHRLRPQIWSAYERVSVLTDQRVTIDTNLRWYEPDRRRITEIDGSVPIVIIETKSPSNRPGSFDRALWRHGYRPRPMSKYAIGLTSFHPHLPVNRWSRARQLLAPTPPRENQS